MEFNQAQAAVKEVIFETIRVDSENYFEAVIVNSNLPVLIAKLDSLFGQPIWPAKSRLPAEIQNIINDFGGIKEGQTLYFCQQSSVCVFAMLWPWQDAYHITLKIAQR